MSVGPYADKLGRRFVGGMDAATNAQVAQFDTTQLRFEPGTVADTTAPTLAIAIGNGTSLKLIYDEKLDAASVPATTAYSVVVNGAAGVNPSVVAVNGDVVTLTIAALSVDDVVTISYTAGASPIQDVDGTDAANLSAQTVLNTTLLPRARVSVFYPIPRSATSGQDWDLTGAALVADATTGQLALQLAPGTGTGAIDSASILNTGSSVEGLRPSEDPYFKTTVRQDTAPIGGTVDVLIGFRDDANTGNRDGVYVRRTDTGNMFLVCRNTTETTSDLGEGITSTDKEVDVKVTGAGTSVRAYINGTAVGVAITTNIPTTVICFPGVFVDNRAATVTTGAAIDVRQGIRVEYDKVA